MKTYFDPNMFSWRARWPGDLRGHPWLHADGNPNDKYYDFKTNPELVSEVLDDWKPWARYGAVQRFYALLRWLNGQSSPFESNDSRFYPPRVNTQKDQWPKHQECSGILMFFFRDIRLNISNEGERWLKPDPNLPYLPPSNETDWLIDATQSYLKRAKPELEWGCVVSSVMPTRYWKLPGEHKDQLGYEVMFQFWAFGDDEQETMNNLEAVIDAIHDSLKNVSEEINV